jgi:hypothetical protein
VTVSSQPNLARAARAAIVLAISLALGGAVGARQEPSTGPPVAPAEPAGEASALAPRCPGRAVLVTRSGELLVTARGFETDGARVRYQNENGTLVAVRLAEIDEAATEEAERRRCPEDAVAAPAEGTRELARVQRPRDPVTEVIDALVELGVSRTKLETLATDRAALRAAVDAVVAVATELERRTREIELTYRLDTVGGMVAAAPAYRQVAEYARTEAKREQDPRIAAVIGDLATAFDEVARLAAAEPERAIEEFARQRPTP